jgi:hypothetical protein
MPSSGLSEQRVILRVPGLFLTEATAAAVGTLLMYMNIMFSLEHPDGLLVLGHIFSNRPAGIHARPDSCVQYPDELRCSVAEG